MIDDSALIHGGTYDPVKAREYYLRTRKLKGRKRGVTPEKINPNAPAWFKKAASGNEGKYTRTQVRSQNHEEARAQAKRRLEDLENRLDRLRNLLSERVDAAKKRAGVEDTTPDKSGKSSKSTTGGGKKDASPATAKEKRDAAKRARESYEKNKKLKPHKADDPSVAEQIKKVEEQIRDVREKLRQATADARKNSEAKSRTKTESSRGRRP